MVKKLKLRAEDEEDLKILSTCLQDALVPVGDMEYFPDDGRFILVANRFCWEQPPETLDPGHEFFERIHCALCIDGVRKVTRRGISRRDPAQLLELLSLGVKDGTVELVFAGGATLRLEVGPLSCQIEDFGEPWPTRWRPHHAIGN